MWALAAEPVAAWVGALCQEWMEEDPQSAGTLYVDGHVRVYHGQSACLPKHSVSRQRLCLRATTDYWVNAMDGQPFFVVHRPVDPGLLRALEQLCEELTQTDTVFPTTPLRLVFTLVPGKLRSSENPGDREV